MTFNEETALMVLKVGKDCSGIDFKHLFSSEIVASCKETIQAKTKTPKAQVFL
jgi:hypothetical protein